nr:colorectal cancer-associated protein 2 [Pogona vitticeps]
MDAKLGAALMGNYPVLEGKPKVYQGVRVKITVKELLQQRRAKQAVAEEAGFQAESSPARSRLNPHSQLFHKHRCWTYLHSVSGEGCSSVQIAESFSPPSTAPFVDGGLESPSPAGCLQPWPFQNCLSCEEIPSYLEQLVESCMQTEPPLDASLGVVPGSLSCSPESYQPGLVCINQSLGPGSPDSSDPSGSFDCSYSSPQPPPYVPTSYSTPSPLEAKSCMYPSSEGIPFQSHDTQYHASPCCCTSCGSQHLDSFRVPEYFPYANTDCREYPPSVSVGDDCFGRDRHWDTCYS